jgi:transaldolase
MFSAEDDGLCQLVAEGVSPWLDGVSQEVIASGQLTHLISNAAVRGATSNVDALNAALAGDWHYRDRLASLAKQDISVETAARSLSAYDARLACAELWPVFETSRHLDGHVSIELNPVLARDVESTVRDAAELSRLVNRSNLLVKIRVTEEGIPAIRECLGAGIGVHASDISSVYRYGDVLDAYFDGLELAVAAGLRPSTVAMVASLPVGRIDAEFDARLDAIGTAAARALRGQGALAIARLAYQVYEQRLGTGRWRRLRAAGALPPRLMWTDTTVSDPAYPPTRYVDEFVAWGTASAMSLPTLDAVARGSRLHGDTLTSQHERASAVLDEFERFGVSSSAVADRLDVASAGRQVHAWRKLLEHVASQLRAAGWKPR